MHTTHSMQRLTTQYIEQEDRMRLSGQLANGETVVLWLTQRLLHRLVPHLSAWLEQRESMQFNHPQVQATQQAIVQSMAQQAARAQLAPPPVQAPPAHVGGLVELVNLSFRGDVLVLTFQCYGQEPAPATLPITPQPLRQWLGIVFEQCQHAQWPTTARPSWMQVAQTPQPPESTLLH